MGNFCSIVADKGRKLKATKRNSLDTGLVNSSDDVSIHEGIKTVETVERSCSFSNNSHLCISIITWNMNGQVNYEDIEKLVNEEDRKFDLLVIGLQEVTRNNISDFIQNSLLHSHTLIGKATMQSLQLYVYGPNNSHLFTKEVKVDKHGVGGFGGLIGRKKGAVGMRINYKGILMEFISCHLSAHTNKVEERNSECRHISHSLFSKYWNPYSRPAQVTIWLGDLNYRLQGINNIRARSLIQKDLHNLLRNKDQLLQEAERGQIFDGYCEGTLSFRPTFKYNIGSSNYDTSCKVRVPSWTDRILFKIEQVNDSQKINAALHLYDSVDSINSSDHKPVKAHICLKLESLR